MTEHNGSGIITRSVENQEEALEVLEELVETARAEAVFSRPAQAGDYTVITAAEVSVGMGFGFGTGAEHEEDEIEEGTGGGGGGFSSGRPVAAIILGPGGVIVEPIVDVTKIVLAFISAFVGLFVAYNRINSD